MVQSVQGRTKGWNGRGGRKLRPRMATASYKTGAFSLMPKQLLGRNFMKIRVQRDMGVYFVKEWNRADTYTLAGAPSASLHRDAPHTTPGQRLVLRQDGGTMSSSFCSHPPPGERGAKRKKTGICHCYISLQYFLFISS